MKQHVSRVSPIILASLLLFAIGAPVSSSAAPAQNKPKFVIKPVAEKKLDRLPTGPLYWRIETFPTVAQAKAAEGPTSLAAEIDGKAWLFTLGPKGGSTPGGSAVIEIGPVPSPGSLPEYLLRINNAGGPPGAKTRVHTHPGSETFYVLQGELSQKTPNGSIRVEAGQGVPGHTPGTAMEVSSSGTRPLNVLVMFVVDAGKPFSSPARFE
jgi:mannose-6-phosphate isomerase-like protein (cupin superfamily)